MSHGSVDYIKEIDNRMNFSITSDYNDLSTANMTKTPGRNFSNRGSSLTSQITSEAFARKSVSIDLGMASQSDLHQQLLRV